MCALRGSNKGLFYVFLSDSLKLYLVQVRAGADVRDGEWVRLLNGKEGRGEEGSDTSVLVAARLSTLS